MDVIKAIQLIRAIGYQAQAGTEPGTVAVWVDGWLTTVDVAHVQTWLRSH